MRGLSLVASLAAVFLISNISSGIAATAEHKMAHASANASYASNASQAKADEVPANCIRQSCGKLWCWQMSGGKSSSR